MLKIALVLAYASVLFFQAWNAARVIPEVTRDHDIAQQHAMP